MERIEKIIAGLATIVGIGVIAFVRFRNPTMTETQLFITFWWLWLSLVCMFILIAAAPRKYA